MDNILDKREITCKDCWRYGDLHSSCFKVRSGEVDKMSPACKDIKYIKTCANDCISYGDTHSSCFKVRDGEVNRETLACKNIKERNITKKLLKEITNSVDSSQDNEYYFDEFGREDILSIEGLHENLDIQILQQVKSEQGPVKKLVPNKK